MRIMNVTNYSAQKQNRPNFGMKLDFDQKAIAEIGETSVAKLAAKVDSWRTEASKLDLMVKGKLLKRKYHPTERSVLLSVDTGGTKIQTKCFADPVSIEIYLAKINSCTLL